MTSRAAFEVHMTDNGAWPRAVERNASGDYMLMQTVQAWPLWCAARKAALEEAAQALDAQHEARKQHDNHAAFYARMVRELI